MYCRRADGAGRHPDGPGTETAADPGPVEGEQVARDASQDSADHQRPVGESAR